MTVGRVGVVQPRAGAPSLATYWRAILRDRFALGALLFLIMMVTLALFAEVLAPRDPARQSLRARMLPPLSAAPEPNGAPYILGSDALGRDILSRIMYGARISLSVGFASVLLSGIVGTFLGLWAGYSRGWVDDVIMRLVDIQMGFPPLLLALLVLYAAGPGFVNIILVLAIVRWPVYARVTRSIVLGLREAMFVEAARVIGCRDSRIVFRHILPNLLSPILVLATLDFALVILTEAALDFLGLGIQAPQTSWGLMLAQGREFLATAWWLVTIPGVVILLSTLSLNLLASWVRTITDPTLRWRWLAAQRGQAA